jgi:predicted Rossmann-fold nucleotide-binding protein
MISDFSTTDLVPIFNYLKDVPFDVRRKQLYSPFELYAGFSTDDASTFEMCYDTKVYRHYVSTSKRSKIVGESLARTLHDHCIHRALDDFFDSHDHLLCIGVMGGHALLRTSSMYRSIAYLSKRLTQLGFFMLSGGGPGAMEATHLGAWMAGYHDDDLEDALLTLSSAPNFKENGWLSTAFQVMRKYPQKKYVSLGIPTWLYGHEPSTPFATHIAKFFENSIREDSILTLAYGGIIYTPGSAGTMQEIFQDAVQNHYLSFGFSSPMIFFGSQFWTEEMPAYSLLKELTERGKYKNLLLCLTDEPEEAITELLNFQHEANVRPDKFVLK